MLKGYLSLGIRAVLPGSHRGCGTGFLFTFVFGIVAANALLWEGLKLKEFMEDYLLWDRPHVGAGKECEEEGAVDATCDEQPHSLPPCTTQGEEVEKSSEVELR